MQSDSARLEATERLGDEVPPRLAASNSTCSIAKVGTEERINRSMKNRKIGESRTHRLICPAACRSYHWHAAQLGLDDYSVHAGG